MTFENQLGLLIQVQTNTQHHTNSKKRTQVENSRVFIL